MNLKLYEDLRYLAEQWKKETNGDLGIIVNVDEHLRDLQRYIENPFIATVLLLVKEDKVVGYMGLAIFKSPLSNQVIANEHYWYVLPEFRKAKLTLKMFDEAKKWAKDKGCSHLLMNASNLASSLHDKICRLYERLGLKKFETSYIQSI